MYLGKVRFSVSEKLNHKKRPTHCIQKVPKATHMSYSTFIRGSTHKNSGYSTDAKPNLKSKLLIEHMSVPFSECALVMMFSMEECLKDQKATWEEKTGFNGCLYTIVCFFRFHIDILDHRFAEHCTSDFSTHLRHNSHPQKRQTQCTEPRRTRHFEEETSTSWSVARLHEWPIENDNRQNVNYSNPARPCLSPRMLRCTC